MRFWPFTTLDRNYVSDLDKFLLEFDRNPSAYSKTRRQEETLYARIAFLRDHKEKSNKNAIWENF